MSSLSLLYLLLVIELLSVLFGHQRKVVLVEDRHLQVPFNVRGGGHFAIGGIEYLNGSLVHFPNSLYFRYGHKRKAINSMKNLIGNVELTTSSEALAFVRLRTSPKTFGSFANGGRGLIELIPRSQITKALVYGDGKMASLLWKWPSGWFGVIDDKDFARFCAARATHEARGKVFLVSRTVMSYDFVKESGLVFRIQEVVYPDGEIYMSKCVPITLQPAILRKLYVPKSE
ncbi:MAG: hypothetical protein HONBIEJF_00770 [Fimbriimonadaceae bacterium]|nr:hypothetical protein [Fimbriimonadaceae bacterium]